MPSRKRRRRTEEESESIWSILRESISEGIVRTVLSEGNKLAEEFMARQQNAMGKKADTAKSPGVEPVVDNATTKKPDPEDDIIEGEFKYVD